MINRSEVMIYTGSSGKKYQLESNRLAGGGEGDVYRVRNGKSRNVAKIYHANKLSQELENKLKYMVANPPDQSILKQVAWPLDVLYDTNNKFCGFVMPKLSINAELRDIYQYPPTVGLSASNKVVIAENICTVISAVHNAGYVFGDFNPKNIGVDKNSGKVAFLDTDSYHVFDKAKNVYYRCKVCAPGYAAPELLEACANHVASHPNDSKRLYEKTPLPTFTKKTDNFALAIHIFKLLMNGFTPFGGISERITASQAYPSIENAAISRNEYSFRPGYKPMSPAVPPLDIFPQEITDLFMRAFLVVGTVNPSQRPTSIEWHQALSRYEDTLVTCSKDKLHQYDSKNETCPFCEADIRYQNSISEKPVQSPISLRTSTPISLPQQKTYSQAQSGSSTLMQSPSRTYGGGSVNTVKKRKHTPPWFANIAIIAVLFGVSILVFVMIDNKNGKGKFFPTSESVLEPYEPPSLPTLSQPTPNPFPLDGTTWVFDNGKIRQTLLFTKDNFTFVSDGDTQNGTYTLENSTLTIIFKDEYGEDIEKYEYDGTKIVDLRNRKMIYSKQ